MNHGIGFSKGVLHHHFNIVGTVVIVFKGWISCGGIGVVFRVGVPIGIGGEIQVPSPCAHVCTLGHIQNGVIIELNGSILHGITKGSNRRFGVQGIHILNHAVLLTCGVHKSHFYLIGSQGLESINRAFFKRIYIVVGNPVTGAIHGCVEIPVNSGECGTILGVDHGGVSKRNGGSIDVR